jgi:hypothetical protein
MFILYCDETNLEERSGDFFVYAGLAINSSTAKSLSQKIDEIRIRLKVPREFKLKFNPGPQSLSNADFIKLKQEIIEAAIAHDVKLLAYVVLHDISKEPEEARRNGINTICYHFDCMLNVYLRPGVVLIDRFSDKQIDQHLAEKFSIGVTGLPFSDEYRLANVVGFHYSAIGQSHFSSLIDIVIGSLRFSINAFTRKDKSRLPTAGKLIKLISPLFHRESSGRVSEISFYFSPKTIKIDQYLDQYVALKTFLADNGADTAQTPKAAA